ncbi:MAG: efflux RND transporter periplasmic adaptor subunit [Candidatus Absconditabacterales bacterium]|nr:efflux RND transporter periplasmic adaptor subunit [Candidatus Absconditabacterales bacterium]
MKKIVYIAIITMLILNLTGCGEREYTKIEPQKLPVEVYKTKIDTIKDIIRVTGDINPSEKVNVSTKLMGKILSIPYNSGEFVKKGELLLEVEAGDIKAVLLQAKAGIEEGNANIQRLEAQTREAQAMYDNININFGRIQTLYEKGSVDRKRYDDTNTELKMSKAKMDALKASVSIVKANIKKAEAMMQEAEANLEYSKFYAPFDGFVVEKYLDEQNITSPGVIVLVFQKISTVMADFKVSGLDINKIKKAAKVIISIDALKKDFEGSVEVIIPSLDPVSRAFVVRVKLDNADNRIIPGMFCRGNIISREKKNALIIPVAALVEIQDETFVYKVINEKVERVRIKTGIRNHERIEVIEGISQNDIVITNGKQNVTDKSSVRVVKREDVLKHGTL